MLKIIALVLLIAWLPSGCIAAREQASASERVGQSTFCWPLTTFRYSRSVASGDWLAPRGRGSWHLGVDMFAPTGSPVRAIADGVVYDISHGGWGSGNVAIMVKHTLADGRWFIALYGHIRNSQGLHKGSQVRACSTIGIVGCYSCGSHLHFGVITPNTFPHAPYGTSKRADHNHFVDPLYFLRTGRPSEGRKSMLQSTVPSEKATDNVTTDKAVSLRSENKKHKAKKEGITSRSTTKKLVQSTKSSRKKKQIVKKKNSRSKKHVVKSAKKRATSKVRSLTTRSKRAVSAHGRH